MPRTAATVVITGLVLVGCRERPVIEGDPDVARVALAEARRVAYLADGGRVLVERCQAPGEHGTISGQTPAPTTENMRPAWCAYVNASTESKYATGGLLVMVDETKTRVLRIQHLK